jgi:GTP cyclohydrolase II
LSKSVELLPAILSANLKTSKMKIDNLNYIAIEDLISFFEKEPITREVISARLPTETAKSGKLHVFRPDLAGPEHYAMEYGQIDRNDPVLVRIHSACFTGDILGSLKCDCGAQLGEAMNQINQNSSGILLYLNQEGRGIGLANKMRAYALQDEGFDTVEANHRLGFEDDERNFQIGASILKELKITSIRLMTNNPRKIQLLEENGVKVVERLALKVDENEFNAHYLGIKATKSGHLL